MRSRRVLWLLALTMAACTGEATNFGPGGGQPRTDAGLSEEPDLGGPGPGPQGPDLGKKVCTGSPDDPGGITCTDPCAGKAPPVTAEELDKKILFYAPANYHYGVNVYANAVQNQLTQRGYKVTLVTAVNEGVKFDECNLYRSFKQIWLFMPCNNSQTMDDASFEALKKYYQFGGGVLLLTDNHYFAQSNPNTHCSQTNFTGTSTKLSDAARVANELLGIAVESKSYTVTPPTSVNATHPLAQVMGLLKGGLSWQQFQIDPKSNPDFQFLPLSYGAKSGKWAGLIEANRPSPDPKLSGKRLALVLTPVYCYHCTPSTSYNYGAFYEGIASYFNTHVTASEKTTASTPAPGQGLPDQMRSDLPGEEGPTLPWLRQGLRSEDHHLVGESLLGLAAAGELDFDSIRPYFEHPKYFVRHHAVLAASQLPRESTVPQLLELLDGGSKHQLMGASRSLAGHDAAEAVEPLLALLQRSRVPEVRREVVVTLGGLRARAAVEPLLALHRSADAELQTTIDRALSEILRQR